MRFTSTLMFSFLMLATPRVSLAQACVDVLKCEQECPCAQDAPWSPDLIKLLNEFKTCNPGSDDTSDTACNVFLARALNMVYRVKDFGTAGKYMNSTAVLAYVRAHPEVWTSLGTLDGTANDQQALDNAQGYANLGKPVIAVKPGHVALIVPGTKQAGWAGLKVPCSAAFRIHDGSKAYVGCKLSFSWSAADRVGVGIYGRNTVPD
jgi:hypothetical protein